MSDFSCLTRDDNLDWSHWVQDGDEVQADAEDEAPQSDLRFRLAGLYKQTTRHRGLRRITSQALCISLVGVLTFSRVPSLYQPGLTNAGPIKDDTGHDSLDRQPANGSHICQICAITFIFVGSLARHQRKVHGPTTYLRPIEKCPWVLTGERFPRMHHLSSHGKSGKYRIDAKEAVFILVSTIRRARRKRGVFDIDARQLWCWFGVT